MYGGSRGGGGFRGGGGGGGGGGGFGGGGGRRRYDDGPRGGAEHLARIHGTEEDKVNCPFYYKIGACRHGDRCSRQHHKPPFSQTLLLSHMWQNPASAIIAAGGNPNSIDVQNAQDEFEDFYEEVYEELGKFGRVEDMHVCDNLGDHLVGNVYVKFSDEEEADAALKGLYGRWYAGRPIVCEFSPVTDFREARCRQYDEGTCNRGGQCNFMHVRRVSRSVVRYCEKQVHRMRRKLERSRSASRSRGRDRKERSRSRDRDRRRRSRSRERSHRNKDHDRDRSTSRDRERRERKRSRREKDKERGDDNDRSSSKRDRNYDREDDGNGHGDAGAET